MNKKTFFDVLTRAISNGFSPKAVTLEDFTNDRDSAFGRTSSAIYLHYNNSNFNRTYIKPLKSDVMNEQNLKELSKYKNWLEEFKIQNNL